jgi:thiamine-phosphate diphosphorylase
MKSADGFAPVWVGSPAAAQLQLGPAPDAEPGAAIGLARRLRGLGARTVLLLRVDHGEHGLLHWLESEHACGWLRPAQREQAEGLDPLRVEALLAEALGAGFVGADAAILACMRATGGTTLPQLSWGEQPWFAPLAPPSQPPLGLYAIVNSTPRLQQVLDAGVRTVQLRIKRPPAPGAGWSALLRRELANGIAAAARAQATLFVNDYWELARELGATGVHLGQEDLQALGEAGRQAVRASGVELGISSHSVWELCRARALAPRYVACGPVWPTTTKDMPWRPQGEHNLRWWCRAAGGPVVAIGGILEAGQVEQAAAWGADGVCIVRGLGVEPALAVPRLQQALEAGRRAAHAVGPVPDWPHPSLPAGHGAA